MMKSIRTIVGSQPKYSAKPLQTPAIILSFLDFLNLAGIKTCLIEFERRLRNYKQVVTKSFVKKI